MLGKGLTKRQLLVLILEVVLTLGLLAVASLRLAGLRRDWRTVSQVRALASAGPVAGSTGPVLETLGGIAASNDRPVLFGIPQVSRGFVLFVLHGRSLRRDLTLWDGVARSLRSERGLDLVAYCDGLACDRAVGATGKLEPFPIVGYTEYHTARVLAAEGRRDKALLVDPGLRLIRPVFWTEASPPADVASAIEDALK